MNQKIFNQLIAAHFSRDEVRTLCFNLEIDPDDFPIEKAGLIRELILYCIRTNSIMLLLEECKQMRPNSNWPTVSTSFPNPPAKTSSTPFLVPKYSTSTCFKCEGKKLYLGKICPVCKGDGHTNITPDQYVEQPRLDITTICFKCKGDKIYLGKTCPTCDGKGFTKRTPDGQTLPAYNLREDSTRWPKCDYCKGTGMISGDMCAECRGNGRLFPYRF